jgi:hypothetical protein
MEDYYGSWALRQGVAGYGARLLALHKTACITAVKPGSVIWRAQFGDKYSQFGVVGGAGRALLSVESKITVQRFFFA